MGHVSVVCPTGKHGTHDHQDEGQLCDTVVEYEVLHIVDPNDETQNHIERVPASSGVPTSCPSCGASGEDVISVIPIQCGLTLVMEVD
jgi:hypothetical protein